MPFMWSILEVVKGKVRINADWQVKRSKCPAAVGELAPSKESWPAEPPLLLLHTSTNVSLQAAAAARRLLDQMTLPGLSDDSGHCPPLLPLCTTVERSITVKRSTTVERSCQVILGTGHHFPCGAHACLLISCTTVILQQYP